MPHGLDLFSGGGSSPIALMCKQLDPCGESGEFHPFAYAGPMFHQDLAVRVGEIVERGGFVFADVVSDS